MTNQEHTAANPGAESKASLRLRLAAVREGLSPAERAARSHEAAARLLGLPAYRQARSLMVYVSFRTEVETGGLIQAALADGKVVLVPKVQRQPKSLLACRIRRFPEDLQPGAYGILEPAPAASEPWPPEQIDLVVVPGLGFDRRGRRLGYGGGYYDRFLAGPASRGVAVGLAFAEQVVGALPADPFDRSLDLIVTDQEVLVPHRRQGGS
ncbi:MAG: 5-formyltetrahydrofolate cyclo-ligase [Bacillota bacterium]